MKTPTRVLALFLVVGLAASLVVAASPMWDWIQLETGWGLPERVGPPLLIISHHGDLDQFPENSAESIWAAAALQPDGIEIDVHQSASGTWWAFHDRTLDRTTDGEGRLATLSDRAIDSAVVDAGPGFKPNSDSVFHVSRLRDVLAGLTAFRGRIYLDLQHAESGDPADLAGEIAGMQVAVICRSAADASVIKAGDPKIETILSVTLAPGPDVDDLFAEASLHGSPGLIAGLRLPVIEYVERAGIDEYPLMRRAWATGAKAFLTNHLREALAARDAFAAGDR
jgi:glycerophosphoryl diester phosphodiesterase